MNDKTKPKSKKGVPQPPKPPKPPKRSMLFKMDFNLKGGGYKGK